MNDLSKSLSYIVSNWVEESKKEFASNPLANFIRNDFVSVINNAIDQERVTYQIKASPGAGNWANVPWLSILDSRITTTTQDGIYPVYLFRSDGSGVYLSLNQGTTIPINNLGKTEAEKRSNRIKEFLFSKIRKIKRWDNEPLDLRSNTTLGKSYEKPNIASKFYGKNELPSEEILIKDLNEILLIYNETIKIWPDFEFQYTKKMKKENYNTKLKKLSKPFLLLAGISGTGKTRFVREQAKINGNLDETYRLVPVRPDWHEPSDLLGYVSRLSGDVEYVSTDVLKFIVKAWMEINKADIELDINKAKGDKSQLHSVRPYWLCLDEMNLAPVEQYFADYLSILETCEWQWTDDEFEYSSEPLLKAHDLKILTTDSQTKLRKELGLKEDDCDELWQHFLTQGIGIPFNLIVAGTVNMDETTHGFSRKVIDRALSFDFGEFYPNNFDEYFVPKSQPKALSYPIWTAAHNSQEQLPKIDNDGKKSIEFLKKINKVLENTPFKLAYRALNELLLSVICHKPISDIELQAVWDDFLMCKVLPRIEGDIDKLSKAESDESILIILSNVLKKLMSTIWEGEIRPDLYRENIEDNNKQINIVCRSRKKLEWMESRLEIGFTSFWP